MHLIEEKIEVRDYPNGIFGSWAPWTRPPPDLQSSWETSAAAVAAAAAADPPAGPPTPAGAPDPPQGIPTVQYGH